MNGTLEVGQGVIYADAKGVDHKALVTVAWDATTVNLVFVSSDETRRDEYGRQIERATSVSHVSIMGAHGGNWRLPGEKQNPYKPPAAQ